MTVWAEEGLSCRGFPVAPKRSEGGFVHYDNGQTAEVSLVIHPGITTKEFAEMKPEMRHKLAQLPFEEKIRKVGELIRLRQKIKTAGSNASEEAALLASLDEAAAELDSGKGVPIEKVREKVREWSSSPKNSKE